MKIKLNKNQKARLLAAVAAGELDSEQFPEFQEAFVPYTLKPMTRGMAKRIIETLNDQPTSGKSV